MKNLDNIINNNRDSFDSHEPDDGHFERFQSKLKKQSKMKKSRSLKFLWKAASVAIIIAFSGIVAYNYMGSNGVQASKRGMSLSDVSPEYEEVETYLQSNVEDKLDEFVQLQCNKGDIDKAEILEELKDLDTMYVNLQKELLQNSTDERIINAMINCYQMKVEVLDQIINTVSDNC